MAPYALSFFAILAGVASHLFYYNRYEFHRYVDILLAIYATAILGTQATLVVLFDFSTANAALTTTWLAIGYLLGATTSTFVWRLFFNPLNKFPGPFAARVTNFWIFFNVRKKLNFWQVLEELHKQYGPYVRVGSDKLSIIDPAVAEMAYSARSPALKGEFYDAEWPNGSMNQERDKIEHDRRRRHWAPAFSDKALRDYEPRVHHFNQKFIERLAEQKGAPVNVSEWFNLYSFDVMGSLAFGKDYRMLESGERHYALNVLTDGLAVIGMVLPMWVIRLLLLIPGASKGYRKLHEFCRQQLREAVKNKFHSSETPGNTITSWLFKGYEGLSDPGSSNRFVQDAKLLVVAGSDTTAASLTFLFFELVRHPEHVAKIREELYKCGTEDLTDRDLRNCEHLNGAINESLRLYPPGPSGLYRETPPEGMRVGDVFIPGKTIFNIPQYIIGRDESLYVNAAEFIPDRWNERSELVKSSKAFNPFVSGSPTSCIGKNVALMEMRSLTARLLLKYDVTLAPHEDGTRLLKESKDHFTMTLAPLDLVFRPTSFDKETTL